MDFNVENIREEFPILKKKINGKQLIYFDSAATSQTPKSVINSISNYYKNYNSNIHRGVHSLSEEATEAYEKSREIVRNHFNAKYKEEIIFTSGTTHSINIVSNGFINFLKKDDEIIVSGLEHHSNIVPLQMMCNKANSKLKVIPINENGELNLNEFKNLISKKTKLVFLNHVSNALGVINPIDEIIKISHENNAYVLIDGAQSAAHFKIDLQKLDIDFFTASAHKLCGPTGVGFLYGKKDLLEKIEPLMGGGEMISDVTFEKTTYANLPHKHEAGTPNISGVIAFGVALDYMNSIGFDKIKKYEDELLNYANKKLKEIDGLIIYGDVKNKTSVISFNIYGIHSYDIGSILDKYGIAVRTGQHCTQPIMDYFKIPGTVRVSLSFINTFEEIDTLYEAILKAKLMLS
ncbi:MAG: cysteine desulfurase CsdA [Flavobacteriales bacterium]|nr:cysteine desulfurase CsdA [Flavobacteriales bacterium]